jgi:serine/threonine protein kinase
VNRIANYIIDTKIQERGDYIVYSAHHVKLQRKTLLKLYRGGNRELIERFEREAKILADFNHPSIVSVYDYGEWEGVFFIAIEYVRGQTLARFMQNGQTSAQQKMQVIRSIVEAVIVIHERGVLHRDLKPENLMLNQQGEIKITDFGISFYKAQASETIQGVVKGTPAYMAPEQLSGEPYRVTSEVYSLGVIFYELLTGVNPFRGDNINLTFQKITSVKPPVFDHPLMPLLQQMLQKNPQKRPTDLQAVKALLPSEAESENEADRTLEIAPKASSAGRRRLFFAVVLILSIIISSVAFLLVPDTQESQPLRSEEESFRDSLVSNADSTARSEPAMDSELISKIIPAPEATLTNSPGLPNIGEQAVAAPAQLPQPGTLSINTLPWAIVIVDNDTIGTSPIHKHAALAPGHYKLQLNNPYYPTWNDSIEIVSGKNSHYLFNFDSLFWELKLDVMPWGDIYINDKYYGTTPLQSRILLRRVEHILTIRNSYHRVVSDTLVPPSGMVLNLKVNLEKGDIIASGP